MSTRYKVTYEHQDGDVKKREEVILESENEPSDEEAHEAVLQDLAMMKTPGTGVDGVAKFDIIRIAPADE